MRLGPLVRDGTHAQQAVARGPCPIAAPRAAVQLTARLQAAAAAEVLRPRGDSLGRQLSRKGLQVDLGGRREGPQAVGTCENVGAVAEALHGDQRHFVQHLFPFGDRACRKQASPVQHRGPNLEGGVRAS